MRIQLLSRSHCGLCEEAEATLRALGVEFEKRNVDQDPAIRARFTDRVPVLMSDGRVIGEGRLSAAAVRRALAR